MSKRKVIGGPWDGALVTWKSPNVAAIVDGVRKPIASDESVPIFARYDWDGKVYRYVESYSGDQLKKV